MHILFDIGGTTMRIAALHSDHFEAPVKLKTPADDIHESIRLFVTAARELAGTETIESATGGIAGVFDRDRKQIMSAPHLPGWVGVPVDTLFEEALGAPVFIENDAAVVGLGEATAGAGRGARTVAYLTVSTGIGGARIVAGKIEPSSFGFEPGHQIVALGKYMEGDNPDVVDLEGYISGTSFARRYGKPAYEVGEKAAWEEAAYILAAGLHNLSVFWSPDVIVIGGSMMVGVNGSTIPLASVERHFERTLHIFPERPSLRLAELGDEGGLHGAEAIVRSRTR
jgi:predicted NBD/HSP70 family sugar kinase